MHYFFFILNGKGWVKEKNKRKMPQGEVTNAHSEWCWSAFQVASFFLQVHVTVSYIVRIMDGETVAVGYVVSVGHDYFWLERWDKIPPRHSYLEIVSQLSHHLGHNSLTLDIPPNQAPCLKWAVVKHALALVLTCLTALKYLGSIFSGMYAHESGKPRSESHLIHLLPVWC